MEGEIGSSPQKIHKIHRLNSNLLNQSKASNQFLENTGQKRDTAPGNGDDSLFERQQNNLMEGLDIVNLKEWQRQNTDATPQNTMPPNKPVGISRQITYTPGSIKKVTSPTTD